MCSNMNEIITLEKRMWEAFVKQDVACFRELVADDALMVIGGVRSTGAEEAQMLSLIKFPPCELSEFQVIALGEDVVLVHYTATFMESPFAPPDFSGRYYVSSIWQKRQIGWQLVFNQDVRPPSDGKANDTFATAQAMPCLSEAAIRDYFDLDMELEIRQSE